MPETNDAAAKCAAMSVDDRRAMQCQIKQALLDCGVNAFGLDLLCESLLRNPEPQPLDFVYPIARDDCRGWAGVQIVLTPIRDHSAGDSDADSTDQTS